jgi:hypothetical protein
MPSIKISRAAPTSQGYDAASGSHRIRRVRLRRPAVVRGLGPGRPRRGRHDQEPGPKGWASRGSQRLSGHPHQRHRSVTLRDQGAGAGAGAMTATEEGARPPTIYVAQLTRQTAGPARCPAGRWAGGSSAHTPTVLTRGYRRQLDFAWVGSGEPVAAGAGARMQPDEPLDQHRRPRSADFGNGRDKRAEVGLGRAVRVQRGPHHRRHPGRRDRGGRVRGPRFWQTGRGAHLPAVTASCRS